jgi:galactokinase
VLDTHVRRELAQVAFNERVQQCAAAFEVLRTLQPAATCLRDIERDTLERARPLLEPPLAARAAHVVEEVARTFEARAALLAGDVAAFGARMTAAHASLRGNFEVSVRELDLLVERATSVQGVHGARLTGAGFGGCVVALLARAAEPALREACGASFEALHGWRPSVEVYRPGGGPRRIDA